MFSFKKTKTTAEVLVAPLPETVFAQPEAAKKLLKQTVRDGRILSHAQIHLICTSYGLVIRHYSEFVGKMPSHKIFSMPEMKGTFKMFTVTDHFTKGWKKGEDTFLANTGKHGRYYSEEEMTAFISFWKTLDEKVVYNFNSSPPLFIIAPKEMFNAGLAEKISDQADPIMVERIGEDEYRVSSFWNTPESVSVHISDPAHN